MDVRIDLARRQLSLCLDENPSTFEAVSNQVDRAAELVKVLGGLDKLSDYDRAKVSHMIETQIGMGIQRGDFDFVFCRRAAAVAVPEYQIARLDLAPDDIVVLKVAGVLRVEDRARLEAMVREIFAPPRKILVLDSSIDLSSAREAES